MGKSLSVGRVQAGLVRLVAVLALSVPAGAALGVPAATARPATHVWVSPVAGDRYAPVGSEISFRGVGPSGLAGLEVVGSKSGVHTGTLRPTTGGAVFVPTRPFAGGEQVTVTSPGVRVDGGTGDSYKFSTAITPSPASAAAALKAAESQPASVHAPQSCPTVTYRSVPNLDAQSVCMNLGVTTSGTPAGSYLFLTPGSGGAGIWDDRGNLVWWMPGTGQSNFNETVVHFDGQPYIALWSGGSLPLAKGVVHLYDEHYQLAGEITAGGAFPSDYVDLHELQITPQGNALIGIYDPVTVGSETVVQYVVQELSLVKDSSGIHTGDVLFEWDSLSDVPTSQSMMPDPGSGGTWDYFHGNAITADSDGNLVVSARNTWGIYKIDDTPGDARYGHLIWTVGASGTSQLSPVPWCYQHDIAALGNNEYSLYDDGGAGPGCVPGSSQHPARGLIFTVDPSNNPATVTQDASYSHTPSIFTAYTGSTQVLANGDMLVDWANVPEITEFGSSGSVDMDLSMSASSYRGFRFAWDGQPLDRPAITARSSGGKTEVWASWNGSTEVAAWQLLGGPSAQRLTPVGQPVPKAGFETSMVMAGNDPVWEAEALNSSGVVLAVSNQVAISRYFVSTSGGAVVPEPGTPAYGSAAGLRLRAPVVAMASTPSGLGYWLVGADGGVFSYGDARYHGSAGGLHPRAPIVGIAASPDGGGYWLAGADGGVFSYGDARYHGSDAGLRSAAPIVGMAADPSGGGYWLASSDAQVTWFGDNQLYATRISLPSQSPLSGIAAGAG